VRRPYRCTNTPHRLSARGFGNFYFFTFTFPPKKEQDALADRALRDQGKAFVRVGLCVALHDAHWSAMCVCTNAVAVFRLRPIGVRVCCVVYPSPRVAFDDFLAAVSSRYFPIFYAEMTGAVARSALVSRAPHDGGALFECVDEVSAWVWVSLSVEGRF
jgi:hypothetical protein